MKSKSMRVLLLEPHPDDIAINMTGYILKHPEHEYKVILFSRITEQVYDEWESFIESIGVAGDAVEYERRQFYDEVDEITDYIYKFKDRFNPDIVFCPSDQDIHQDHIVINKAAITIFGKDTSLIFYGNHNHNLQANYYEVFEQDIMDNKIEILSKFESQKHRDYFNPEFILHSHTFNKAGQYAEPYKIYKKVNY